MKNMSGTWPDQMTPMKVAMRATVEMVRTLKDRSLARWVRKGPAVPVGYAPEALWPTARALTTQQLSLTRSTGLGSGSGSDAAESSACACQNCARVC